MRYAILTAEDIVLNKFEIRIALTRYGIHYWEWANRYIVYHQVDGQPRYIDGVFETRIAHTDAYGNALVLFMSLVQDEVNSWNRLVMGNE